MSIRGGTRFIQLRIGIIGVSFECSIEPPGSIIMELGSIYFTQKDALVHLKIPVYYNPYIMIELNIFFTTHAHLPIS